MRALAALGGVFDTSGRGGAVLGLGDDIGVYMVKVVVRGDGRLKKKL